MLAPLGLAGPGCSARIVQDSQTAGKSLRSRALYTAVRLRPARRPAAAQGPRLWMRAPAVNPAARVSGKMRGAESVLKCRSFPSPKTQASRPEKILLSAPAGAASDVLFINIYFCKAKGEGEWEWGDGPSAPRQPWVPEVFSLGVEEGRSGPLPPGCCWVLCWQPRARLLPSRQLVSAEGRAFV